VGDPRGRLLAALRRASSAKPETIRAVEAEVRDGAAGPYTSTEVAALLKLRLMREGR
jgi:hypothetical protein